MYRRVVVCTAIAVVFASSGTTIEAKPLEARDAETSCSVVLASGTRVVLEARDNVPSYGTPNGSIMGERAPRLSRLI